MNEWLTKDELLAYIDEHGEDCYDRILAYNYMSIQTYKSYKYAIGFSSSDSKFMLIKYPESES